MCVTELSLLVTQIIANYFQNFACVFYFSNNTVPISFDNAIIVTYHISTINISTLNQKCDGIIINAAEPRNVVEAIEQNYRFQNVSRYNYNRRYLILPTDIINQNAIFESAALKFIANLLVIYEVRREVECFNYMVCECNAIYNLLTHKYVGLKEHNKPIVINVWFSKNVSLLLPDTLYPDKLSNQQGRPLTVATFTYKPYSLPDKNTGTELTLAHEFAKRHNNTLNILVYDNIDGQWGVTFPNFTGTGVIGSVVEDKADIGFAAIFLWLSKYWYCDYSHYLVRTGVTVVTPAPTIVIGWVSLFPNFSMEVNAAIGITYITAVGIIILFRYCCIGCPYRRFVELMLHSEDKNIDDFYNRRRNYQTCVYTFNKTCWQTIFLVGKIFLLQPIIIKFIEAKFIITLLYVFAVLLSAMYSSGLSSTMTVPNFEGSIDTVADLASSDIIWAGTQADAWIESIMYDDTKNYKDIVDKFIVINPNNYEANRRMGFAVERLPSGNFAIEDYITEEMLKHLQIMDDDLYSGNCIFITRKNSILLPLINTIVLEAQQAGLHLHWEANTVLQYTNYRKQIELRNVYTFNKQILTIRHIKGVLLLWAIGCFISLMSFIYEYKIKKR